MSLRISLNETESVEYFSNIISRYCDILENLDIMVEDIAELVANPDMYGGIKSYLNETDKQIKKVSNYQQNVLNSLYSYMSTYFTEIGETIYQAYQNSENVNYPNAMAKFFYSKPGNSAWQTTQIANADPDPSGILSEDYSLIEVEVDEQGTRQALKPYYADNDTRVQVANYNTNLDNRQESIIANGLLTTNKTNYEEIAKDFPGLSAADIEEYNKSIGVIDKNGNIHGKLIVPAYNSTDSQIRAAARTVEDGGTYNTPSFEVKEKSQSGTKGSSATATNKNTTSNAQSTSNLTSTEMSEFQLLKDKISNGTVTQEELDRYNALNRKSHGGG